MSKKVNFAARPAASSPAADQWVSERSAASAAAPTPMKRLTIDLEASKHRRFKTLCAQQGLQMADELRRLVDQRIAEIERGQGA
jgi:ParG protein